MLRRRPTAVRAAALALLLAAAPFAAAQEVRDPYEGYNRLMFKFNDKADRYVLKPIARTYRTITPKPARTAVRNFFDNLRC